VLRSAARLGVAASDLAYIIVKLLCQDSGSQELPVLRVLVSGAAWRDSWYLLSCNAFKTLADMVA
jgi:hypothetical protein